VDPNFLEGVKKVFTSGETKDLVDPYLAFSFAGVKVSFAQHHNHGHSAKFPVDKSFIFFTVK